MNLEETMPGPAGDAAKTRLRRRLLRTLVVMSWIRLTLHLVVYKVHAERATIDADVRRWAHPYLRQGPKSGAWAVADLLSRYPEFRTLFYFRIGWIAELLKPLCRPMPTLFIGGGRIGGGFFIQHGFATITLAESIGENCWINQQVTIGYREDGRAPILGNNVRIFAGAKVLGGVRIGDNSVVGANCVVVKDVPPNVTVAGVPARIVRRAGTRVNEPL